MKKKGILMAIAAMIIVLSGCEHDARYDERSLVVDGYIDSDGYPVVQLTRTIAPDAGETPLADCLVRWGKITISDGEQTVILTGSDSEDYFPPFVYRTFKLEGKPGRTYTITAEYDGMKVISSCKMLPPAVIDRVVVNRIEGSDSLCAVSIDFTPVAGVRHYHLLTRVRQEKAVMLPAFMGSIEVDGAEQVTMPVFAPKYQLDDGHFSPQFKLGDVVDIALCSITPEVYDFWSDYDNEIAFGGSVFVTSPGNLRSNITGGYGVWSAQGVARATVKIE